MKQYVRPEMEIDLFEENDGLIYAASGNCPCDSCPVNFGYGEGSDPWN